MRMMIIWLLVLTNEIIDVTSEEEAMLSAVAINDKYLSLLVSIQFTNKFVA